MEPVGGNVLGLAPGDWATSAAAIFAGFSFAFLVYGSLHDRARAPYHSKQGSLVRGVDQARKVGGWLEYRPADDSWRLNVRNSSELPVRRVKGYLLGDDAGPPRI